MTQEVEITGMVYGGDGFGRLADGRAAFVPFVLPGERAEIEFVEEKRGHVRGRLVKLVRPAAMRIQPRCPHFGVCGGCHYQHIPYAGQLTFKETIVREQLARIAGIQDPPVRPIIPSPLEWNYRNSVQFHLDPQGKLGYQAAGSHRVVAIRECHLPEETLNQAWPLLDLEPLPGLERIDLRLGAGDDLLLALEGNGEAMPEFSVDFPLSAVYLGPDRSMVLAGDDGLVIEVLDKPFRVTAGSFFQVNTQQAGAMVKHLLERLPLTQDTTLLDVYCGVGLFSAFMAPLVGRCVGVELSESACNDYAANLDDRDNVELYVGAAEIVLPALDVKPDVVLVDPPRAGLERAALDAIMALAPQILAYVSCDPATLARDIKRLTAGGYQLVEATPFDLFPQTYHIETIALMKWNG
ncbi:23S rRNA m(5)U-1939 methyltransferase [Longilinea arvoryzae]|uniref:23S rRNA m(5)U-1939 methyltransferase n=1 Tax=Longilinea arvoryzae TaxID=360412 RepID=A0A0S7BK80_9CHLR|nr:class I SAM-dependent RNA methyltransferase [Longilinea arvoryzae]GAP14058.1 23S rRNA m(5)U-1939 methyltransferase [Longilinea arvoryzae]